MNKDIFTPEELDALKRHYTANLITGKEHLYFFAEISEDPLLFSAYEKMQSTFYETWSGQSINEAFPGAPEPVETPDGMDWTETDIYINQKCEEFIISQLQDMFGSEDNAAENKSEDNAAENNTASVYLSKDTYLTNPTKKGGAGKDLRQIPGQLRYEWTPDGAIILDIKAMQETGKLTREVAKRSGYTDVNIVLFYGIGTAIEAVYKHSAERGETMPNNIALPRTGVASYFNKQVLKPTPEILSFINQGGMTVEDNKLMQEEKDLKKEIQRHYMFWVDLLALNQLGVLPAPTGSYLSFIFKGYNAVDDTIICESPYFEDVYRDLYNNQRVIIKKDDKEYKKPEVSQLVKPSIYNEYQDASKRPAVETIFIIDERLAELGVKKKVKPGHVSKNKKDITFKISYADLMKNNKELRAQIAPIKCTDKENGKTIEKKTSTQSVRTILDRMVNGTRIYKRTYQKKDGTTEKKTISYIEYLIDNYTVFNDYYFNFKIECDPVKLIEIRKHPKTYGIHITFEGINTDYEDNPTLSAPIVEI